MSLSSCFLILAYAVSPLNTLDELGLDPGNFDSRNLWPYSKQFLFSFLACGSICPLEAKKDSFR